MFVIKEASSQDAEEIAVTALQVANLHFEHLSTEFIRPNFESSLQYVRSCLAKENYKVFKAESDEIIVGYLIVEVRICPEQFFVFSRRGFAESMGVTEEFRGQGIGTALIAEAESWLKKEGIQLFDIDFYCFNREAEKLYEKLGFQELKHYRRKII